MNAVRFIPRYRICTTPSQRPRTTSARPAADMPSLEFLQHAGREARLARRISFCAYLLPRREPWPGAAGRCGGSCRTQFSANDDRALAFAEEWVELPQENAAPQGAGTRQSKRHARGHHLARARRGLVRRQRRAGRKRLHRGEARADRACHSQRPADGARAIAPRRRPTP